MAEPTTITLLKSSNRIVVNPTTKKVNDLLIPKLSFREKRFLYGQEARLAGTRIEITDWGCYSHDHNHRLATSWGFHHRIKKTLKRAGYRVRVQDLDPPKDPKIYQPRWERLVDSEDIELRHKQEECLIKVLGNSCGRIECPPGWGKSFVIGILAYLLPKARIDVATKRVPVLRDRIYPELCGMLPSVGIVGGGKNRPGRRVMCYTFDSLNHSEGDADFLFVDECHEAAADKAARSLAKYTRSRNYGFSASQDMRLDGKDLRVEAMFGPILLSVPYQEAQEHGMVVPIEVLLSDVVMDMDPCEGEPTHEKKRAGIWQNAYRNSIIQKDANRYGDDVQTLITCETIEHAMVLRKRLPNFEVVYSVDGITPRDRRWYVKHGLMAGDEQVMTQEKFNKITKLFEKGKLKKAIATTVWNVGVDFKNLSVLIRGDAGGSPINDIQIPGRVSRTGGDGKSVGIIHDYKDQFNRGFRNKATGRRKMYEKQGWKVRDPRDWQEGRKNKNKPKNRQSYLFDED